MSGGSVHTTHNGRPHQEIAQAVPKAATLSPALKLGLGPIALPEPGDAETLDMFTDSGTSTGSTALPGDLKRYETRLATFVEWQHQSPTPPQLARAGFYYAGKSQSDDLCVCYSCHEVMFAWKPGDDPWAEHCAQNPSCPHLNKKRRSAARYGRSERPSSRAATSAASAAAAQSLTARKHSDIARLTVTSAARKMVEEMAEKDKDRSESAPHQRPSRSRDGSPSRPRPGAVAAVVREGPRHGTPPRVPAVLGPPEDSRRSASMSPTPRMASATPLDYRSAKEQADRIYGQDAAAVFAAVPDNTLRIGFKSSTSRKPTGQPLLATAPTPTPATASMPAAASSGAAAPLPAAAPPGSFGRARSQPGAPPFPPYQQATPSLAAASGASSAASFQTEAGRLATFGRGWMHGESVPPHALAAAGLYFVGRTSGGAGQPPTAEDTCACFACGITLFDWAPWDDPWREHAASNPRCPFLAATFAKPGGPRPGPAPQYAHQAAQQFPLPPRGVVPLGTAYGLPPVAGFGGGYPVRTIDI